MSAAELNTLELEVMAARARFARDLTRLRSPDTYTEFKDDLVSTAKDSATEKVDGLVAELKGKANANPGAVLAIGAGLAWHLARHPPITSLLVGLGLWSLWRTPPAPEGEGFGPRAMELANAAKDKVEDWSTQAKETSAHVAEQATAVKDKVQDWTTEVGKTATHLAGQATATADQVSASVRETVHDMQDAAIAAAGRVTSATRDTASYIQREGGAAREKASALVREHAPDVEARDSLLLGAAALAVTAAVGIAYQRRS